MMENRVVRTIDLDAVWLEVADEDVKIETGKVDTDAFIKRMMDVRKIAIANDWVVPQIPLDSSLFSEELSWEVASKLVPLKVLNVEHPPGFIDGDIVPMMLGDDLCLMDYNSFSLWCIVQSGSTWALHLVCEDDLAKDFRGDAFKDVLHKSGQRFWNLRKQIHQASLIGRLEESQFVSETEEVWCLYNLLGCILAELNEDQATD